MQLCIPKDRGIVLLTPANNVIVSCEPGSQHHTLSYFCVSLTRWSNLQVGFTYGVRYGSYLPKHLLQRLTHSFFFFKACASWRYACTIRTMRAPPQPRLPTMMKIIGQQRPDFRWSRVLSILNHACLQGIGEDTSSFK